MYPHTIPVYLVLWVNTIDMGFGLSTLWRSFVAPFMDPRSVLILGLDNAGKTVVLYCLKLNEGLDYTIPTIGINAEEVVLKGITLRALDLGGQSQFREMWPHYFQECAGVVFVVDSADRDRFDIARDELLRAMCHHDLKDKPFLVLANKQDLPNAASKEEIHKAFGLETFAHTHTFHIIECSAKFNERIHLGVEWILNYI